MIVQKGQFWHFDTIDELDAHKDEYLEHCKDWYISEGLTDVEATQLAFTEYQIKLEVMKAKVKPPQTQYFSKLNVYITPPKRKRG